MCGDLLERGQPFGLSRLSSSREVPDEHGMWVGSASSADHVRRAWRSSPARCGGAGCGSRTGNGSGGGCATTSLVGPTGSRWRWRWRAAPAGGTWSRRSPPPGSKRTWRSRPTRRRRGAASGTPRPTAPTPGCCASCCSPAICPSRGSRRRSCWSGANGCGSTSRWSISARCGCSGSTPSCSSTASPCPEAAIRSAETRAGCSSDEVDLSAGGPATGRGSATR